MIAMQRPEPARMVEPMAPVVEEGEDREVSDVLQRPRQSVEGQRHAGCVTELRVEPVACDQGSAESQGNSEQVRDVSLPDQEDNQVGTAGIGLPAKEMA